jgi:hypothetical protein
MGLCGVFAYGRVGKLRIMSSKALLFFCLSGWEALESRVDVRVAVDGLSPSGCLGFAFSIEKRDHIEI